jgi:uncharacterized SAM-binding protein YcdF (DUF218 family)
MARAAKVVLRILAVLLLLAAAVLTVNYHLAPRSNTSQNRFDTLIVLGYPATPDGKPEPEMRERVLEAVREFKAGVAPRIIVSGAAAHNRFVEADVMAHLAAANGVPVFAIVEERQARNTIENAAYSVRIMQTHGWRSAEVISSPAHVPRAGMIFSAYPVQWRTKASRWPAEYGVVDTTVRYVYEAIDMARIQISGVKPTPH